MRFELSDDLLQRHPTYRVGLVCVWNAATPSPEAQAAIRDGLRATANSLPWRLGGARLHQNQAIIAWERAFEAAEINPNRYQPSVSALAERALRGETIPSINPAVDIGNLISLKRLAPVGAHDMESLPGDIQVRLSRAGDTFVPPDGARENVPPGEPVYATGSDIRTRRWIWRQSEPAMVGPQTRAIVFPVDGFTDSTDDAVTQATGELARLAKATLGGVVAFGFVDAGSPSLELSRRIMEEVDSPHEGFELLRSLITDTATAAAPIATRPPSHSALGGWELSDLLRRGLLDDVIVQDELEKDLASGKRLTIYQGFDPTSTDLHIGHYLSLRVLRWFQLHGHRVIFLFGDFTARIGDPTGQSAERQQLTRNQVLANTATWREQIAHILDFEGDNPIEIKANGDWLESLSLRDMIEIAANITVQQLIERDMFQERLTQQRPLHLHETLYPLLQGYDSVAMSVDAELGGRDQMFNMMVGRDLVRSYIGKTKHVLMTPLIPGLDGRKMSKSYGNTVDLTEAPVEMFFKLTQVSDDLLPLFLNVLTDSTDEEIAIVMRRLETEANLQDVRERFAHELTQVFHGAAAADRAQAEFRRVVDEGRSRQEVNEAILRAEGAAITAIDVAVATGLATSRGDARRLIQQGGLEINDRRQTDPTQEIAPDELAGAIVKMGKRGFVRMRVEQS